MRGYFIKKDVLVTGGTGLIGIPLVKKLCASGARVRVVSRDQFSPFGSKVEVISGDLCDRRVCREAIRGMDVVFHLAGIKGGIGLGQSKAASFLVKNILMNTQVMEEARISKVARFLYASSICIYPPAPVFKEEDAFKGLPHPSDRFGGLAKMTGEMQIEAYKLQYGLENFFIARPANTYGPYDNFDPVSALIIPALICRAYREEDPLVVWGDGSAVRDFVYSEDVADFLALMVERNATGPFNVGSGDPVTVKTIATTIQRCVQRLTGRKIALRWDKTKATGEKYRVTSVKKARKELGWSAKIDLETGIYNTVKWFYLNKKRLPARYTILSEK